MLTITAGDMLLPALGFGTWALRGDVAKKMVEHALGIGYRHIDTAQMYVNEKEVGAGLRASGVARESVFVTTKIWPDRHAPDELRKAAAESLRNLGVDEVDLLLLHWPSKAVPIAETIGALNDVKRQGLARHIGLSNFTTTLSQEAHAATDVPLVCNQVEYHPYLDQAKVLAAAREHDMALVAWSPIAKGRVANEPLMADIAAKHGKNAIQICLRWLIQQPQVSAIPRTSSERHAATNFDIFDFELSAAEMTAISALGKRDGRVSDNGAIEPEWD